MKNIFLISIVVFLTSFKSTESDSYLNFDYEVKYLINKSECSVFICKTNPNDFFIIYDKSYLFDLLRNDNLFKISFTKNEIDYDLSKYKPSSKNVFTEIVETKETKNVGGIVCTKFIGEIESRDFHTVEVFIAKNNKINNVNFLTIQGFKVNSEVKGLIVEINKVNNKTKEVKSDLSLKDFTKNEKSLKIDDEILNKMVYKIKVDSELLKRKWDKEISGGNNGVSISVGDAIALNDDASGNKNQLISRNKSDENKQKYINIAERNHKYFKFKDGNWDKYVAANFKFTTKQPSGSTYNFKAYCTISKDGIITKITDVQPEEYKEEYTDFLNSVKNKWFPDEEYGEKVESSYYILARIVK